ncbi:penicillin acylase family protein [Paracoccus luteus]|uniref:penicillin acylase family protein n=1 Tax=Paracoccus luteus TaxID=2508543 RepID=UPI0010700738|nr:penicillin acylase family protein [Paracoccus luteus]
MLTLFRWLVRLTVGLIVGLVAMAALAWYFAVRSLPDYDADLRVAGISAPVEIVRTTEDVPHIFAGNDADAFFALGLAHAQDRLFQMVVLRRAAQGRLAEIYGARAFPADDMARRLGLWRAAHASLPSQDAATQAALTAYAAGVNAWIEQINAGARGRGAPEFFLYRGDIAYWQPADSLAILKLVAAGATSQLRAEVTRAQVALAVPDRAADLVSGADEPPLPDYAALFGDARFPPAREDLDPDWFDRLAGFVVPGLGTGGNGWAADGKRTAAGAPILANDPQVALTAPSLWYLARIELASGGVIGGTIPGIPAVLSGRNPHLAWGLTPASVDDQDVVMVEAQPGMPDRYLTAQGWTDFATRREIIRVNGAPDREIILRDSIAGPVIPGAHAGLASVTPGGHVAALRWSGLSSSDTTMSALVGLMAAPDRAAGQRAVAAIVAPTVQVTLADAGGVAQVLAGTIPRRPDDHPTLGRMPAPLRTAGTRWLDPLPADAPQRISPPADGMVVATGAGTGGFAGAAGQGPAAPPPPAVGAAVPQGPLGPDAAQPADAPVPAAPAASFPLGYDRDDPLRMARLDRLLAGREIHSRDSFIDAQLDTVSPAARALLPLVGADLWFTGEPAAPGTPERQRQEALGLLAEWDGNMSEHRPEPLIHAAWMAELQRRLIHDELGRIGDRIGARLRPAFIDRVFRNTDGAAVWCDVVQSAPVEDCVTIARQALDAALVDLTARFGGDVSSWRWGDLHAARHEHPGLGRLPVIGWIVSLVQSTAGDSFTVARAGTLNGPGAANPYAHVTGAGYRGVYDLADPDSSVFIISTGQSGHPLSRHYDDLAELWRRGEYIGMSLDPALARAAAEGVTRLTPVE